MVTETCLHGGCQGVGMVTVVSLSYHYNRLTSLIDALRSKGASHIGSSGHVSTLQFPFGIERRTEMHGTALCRQLCPSLGSILDDNGLYCAILPSEGNCPGGNG